MIGNIRKLTSIIVVWVLASLASACGTASGTVPSTWTSVANVTSEPAGFDKKVVTIKGWASIRGEDYGIWATQDDYEKRNWKRCISLLNIYNDQALNESLDRKPVLITGTVFQDIFLDKDGRQVVRLGTCNKVGIRFIEPGGLRSFHK